MEDWLRSGGLVVAASERAALAAKARLRAARPDQRLEALPAPRVQSWAGFVRSEWQRRVGDDRLLLNATQEEAIWAELIGSGGQLATLLEGPRHRLARMAMEAHGLLCSHAPEALRQASRRGWQRDAAAFSDWLSQFERRCGEGGLVSASRLPVELTALLEAEAAQRPPLLLVGFDRILPTQRKLLETWGEWREPGHGAPGEAVLFYEAADKQAELAACALWAGRRLAARPDARLLVITQEARERRGQLERAFAQHAAGAGFEFSLGVPLRQVGLAKAAHLLLRWLAGPLTEDEVDWLLASGHAAASPEEVTSLQAYVRRMRSHGLERTHWSLDAFLAAPPALKHLPGEWAARMASAQAELAALAKNKHSPAEWAEELPKLLAVAGWPGFRPLERVEFQVLSRWQQALEAAGSLGFDGRLIDCQGFLAQLGRVLDETLFAPESEDAPIQICGPAESAGLQADGIWFLGADEDGWPAGGAMHPLIPAEVQRQAGMPHATAALDAELAAAMTARLLASANEVCFSYSRQSEKAEARPSRLAVQVAGEPLKLPHELCPPVWPEAQTVWFEDDSRIPFAGSKLEGGAAILTAQSQCPFKAFALARLGAKGWQAAQAGLTAAQRGMLLHAVMAAVWGGPPGGIRSHAELVALGDRDAFAQGHARRVMRNEIRLDLRERMARRYLELEEKRLARLVGEWLDFEAARVEFDVAGTELRRTIRLAGMTLDVRLDRLDRLNDGTMLVVDYKTGTVSPAAWMPPRAEDVQLPLYAGFALDHETEPLGGLVFARVKAGEMGFAGRVGDAKETLLASLTGGTALVKNPLSLEDLMAWREAIEQLAADFVAGRAEVDPRDAPETCERCGLQAVCRIEEGAAAAGVGDR